MSGTTAATALRLNYICHEPLPSPHTNTEQIVKTAAALVRHGAQVALLFPVPRAGRRDGADLGRAIAEFYGIAPDTFERGLQLVPRPSPAIGNARRVWHDVAAVRLAHRRGGVSYVRDPFAAVTALATGSRVVFESFRIDLSQRARYAPWRRYCLRHRNLLGVVTHSALAAEAFRRAGVADQRLMVAHNGVDPEPDALAPALEAVRRRLGCPPGGRLVVYAGHANRRKGIEALFAMAAALPDYHFALVGAVPDSADAHWLARQLAAAGAANVSTHARVPPAALGPILRAADVLVIPPSARPLERHHRTVLPLKTYRYLAAGRPIVAPDLPDIREVLRHEHNAMLVPPDPVAAAGAITRLAADPDRAARLGAAAASDARRFSWDARAAKILTFLAARLHAAGR